MTIKELIEKAQKSVSDARAILDEFEGKEIPKDKSDAVDKLFDEAEEFKAQADRLKREDDINKWATDPKYKHALADGTEDITDADPKERLQIERKAFRRYLRGGEKVLSPDELKVLSSPRMYKVNDEYVETKALSSTSDPEGGYLVPEEFRAELITKRRDLVFIRQRATVLNTTQGSIGFPSFDYDGSADWTPESGAIQIEDITDAFGKAAFTPHKLTRIFKVPMELSSDSVINIDGLLTSHFAMRFGEIEENVFINGNGVQKPLGLLSSGFTTVDAATADTLAPDDIQGLPYEVRGAYRASGVYMMHRANLKRIRLMKGVVDGQYLWQPGLAAGQPGTISGYPYIESEFFPNNAPNATPGSPLILFGDLSWYWIIDRMGFTLQRLIELYAVNDQVGYKMTQRVDAAPVLKDPFRVLVAK